MCYGECENRELAFFQRQFEGEVNENNLSVSLPLGFDYDICNRDM